MTLRSNLRRGFPTLGYLAAPFRWLFRTRRRVGTAAVVLLAMLAAPPLWWSIQLLGLPDVGDPFDVEGSRPITVADDRNAFVLYRQAADRLNVSTSAGYRAWFEIGLLNTYSEALQHRDFSGWVDENREALVLYRAAAERPDSTPLSDREHAEIWQALRHLQPLALFEASRLKEQGDMAGAWTWYRAVMRTIQHQGTYARFAERREAQRWRDQLGDRVRKWAADPRTTPALIRQALDEAIACQSITPSDSYSFRAECRVLDRSLDEPHNPAGQVTREKWKAIFGVPDDYLSADRMQTVYDLWRSWRREPERSRRVIRLAIANWLAYHDLPAGRRPAADPGVSGPFEFYAFGPEAPAAALALSPADLDHWLEKTPEAREMLERWQMTRAFRVGGDWIERFRLEERANRRAMLVMLASELYRRDRGTDPPSPEALVGPYLKGLPDDGLGDAGDTASRPAATGVQ